MMMRSLIPALALAVGTIASAPQTNVLRPALVELFTSEGCSSCPPADALLAEVAKQRRDVIVLSERVTYWDYLGWRDPYSLDESTERQQAYADALRLRGPYTPQAVVNGRAEFLGSDRGAMQRALSETSGGELNDLRVSLSSSDAAHMSAKVTTERAPAGSRVIAVLVLRDGRQAVARGENGGRSRHTLASRVPSRRWAPWVRMVGLPERYRLSCWAERLTLIAL